MQPEIFTQADIQIARKMFIHEPVATMNADRTGIVRIDGTISIDDAELRTENKFFPAGMYWMRITRVGGRLKYRRCFYELRGVADKTKDLLDNMPHLMKDEGSNLTLKDEKP